MDSRWIKEGCRTHCTYCILHNSNWCSNMELTQATTKQHPWQICRTHTERQFCYFTSGPVYYRSLYRCKHCYAGRKVLGLTFLIQWDIRFTYCVSNSFPRVLALLLLKHQNISKVDPLYICDLTMVTKWFSFSFWLSVLHRFHQQMVAYPESANPDSAIPILWYLDHDYPILEVFKKTG